jgi:hypothetical protein
MVQAFPQGTYTDGLATRNETATTQNRRLFGGQIVHYRA